MELLNNHLVRSQLENNKCIKYSINNNDLQIIINDNNYRQKISSLFAKILSEDKINDGYYKLKNLFYCANMNDKEFVINSILSTITQKIDSIRYAIINENNVMININLGMYTQIWKSYKDFGVSMERIIKIYQPYLVSRDISVGNINYDILTILHICMFYKNIVMTQDNLFQKICNDISEINNNNIDELIDFLESVRFFVIMKNFINVDVISLTDAIKSVVKKTSVTNVLCQYVHKLLIKVNNKKMVSDNDYNTVNTAHLETKIIRKINKVVSILTSYSDQHKLLICYKKFMQARIIDLSYHNYDMEISIVKRMSRLLEKNDVEKLLSIITDMQNIRKYNIGLQNSNLSPIVLSQELWDIDNIHMKINYPDEISERLEIISKHYSGIFENEYFVDWRPILGCAYFEAIINGKKLNINCNILQSIALIHLNKGDFSAESFSVLTNIGLKLSEKILESIYNANLIVLKQSESYTINTHYMGDTNIDLIKIFIEAFQVFIDVVETNESCTDVDITDKISTNIKNDNIDLEDMLNYDISDDSEEEQLQTSTTQAINIVDKESESESESDSETITVSDSEDYATSSKTAAVCCESELESDSDNTIIKRVMPGRKIAMKIK